jgi:hypothetical protein
MYWLLDRARTTLCHDTHVSPRNLLFKKNGVS